jgi:hypothetical protein
MFLLQVAVHERLMTVEDDDAIVGRLRMNWIVCSARAISYAGSASRRADRPAQKEQ